MAEPAPPALLDLLTRAETGAIRLVPASEPLATLFSLKRPGERALRAVAFSPAIHSVAQVVESELMDSPPSLGGRGPCVTCSPTLTGNEGFVLSGALRKIVVIGGTEDGSPTGVPHPAAWLLEVDSNDWTEVPLATSERPGAVLGAAFRYEDLRTYLIDVPPGAAADDDDDDHPGHDGEHGQHHGHGGSGDDNAAALVLRRYLPHSPVELLASLPSSWGDYEQSWLAVSEAGDLVFAATRHDFDSDGKVTLCHKAGAQSQSLRVTNAAAAHHFAHGDAPGDCLGAPGNDLGPGSALVARFTVGAHGELAFAGAKRLATPILGRPIVTRDTILVVVAADPARLRTIELGELVSPPPGQRPAIY